MMRSDLRGRRRYKRRRGRILGPILLALILLALTITAVYYIVFFPAQIEETVYPLEYEEMIHRYAAQYDLDPARVAAVVFCESSFRSDAVSSAGAIGLMQIMPETGKWIAQKLGEADYDQAKLTDPETNLRYGCWYLDYLNGRFEDDLTKVTAAYHAGGGRVDQWLSDAANSSDGKTLQNIPSEVTGGYVQKVRQTYEKYKEIMNR